MHSDHAYRYRLALFAAAHAGSFYQTRGYRAEPGGLSRVMGTWLQHEP
jgi:hypothetical protein